MLLKKKHALLRDIKFLTFYTLTAIFILGDNILMINISSYYMTATVSEYLLYLLCKAVRKKKSRRMCSTSDSSTVSQTFVITQRQEQSASWMWLTQSCNHSSLSSVHHRDSLIREQWQRSTSNILAIHCHQKLRIRKMCNRDFVFFSKIPWTKDFPTSQFTVVSEFCVSTLRI